MARSSSAVCLISEVRNVFVTAERSFKSVEHCKYSDVHLGNNIICQKCHKLVYLLVYKSRQI